MPTNRTTSTAISFRCTQHEREMIERLCAHHHRNQSNLLLWLVAREYVKEQLEQLQKGNSDE